MNTGSDTSNRRCCSTSSDDGYSSCGSCHYDRSRRRFLPPVPLLFAWILTFIVYHQRYVPLMVVGVMEVMASASIPSASKFLQYKYGGGDGTTTSTTTAATITTPTLWVYTGSLMDPYTGQRICDVQGIEYIQPICQFDSNRSSSSSSSSKSSSTTNSDGGRDNYLSTSSFAAVVATAKATSSTSSTKILLPPWFQQYQRRCRSLQMTSIFEEYLRNRSGCRNEIINDDTDALQPSTTATTTTTTTTALHVRPPLVHNVQGTTMISRKLFCYTQNHHNRNNTSTTTVSIPDLFTGYHKIATNPILGPKTHVPLDQVVTCYDSIITSIGVMATSHHDSTTTGSTTSTSSTISNTNNNNNHDPRKLSLPSSWWILHTEIPNTTSKRPSSSNSATTTSNSHCVWSCIEDTSLENQPSPSSSSARIHIPEHHPVFDFSIFTRRRTIPLSLTSIIPTITDTFDHNNPVSTSNKIRSRRRPWLQVGNGSSRKNEWGVRETYQFYNTTNEISRNNVVQVRYTRYGEAPVWYGPGRVCLLELTGTRCDVPKQIAGTQDESIGGVDQITDTLQQHVPVIASVITKYIPDFWNLLPALSDRQLPPPPSSRNHQRRTHRDKHEDDHFVYYAKALQASLQSHDEEWDRTDKERDHRKLSIASVSTSSENINTAEEYRQYYHDLAIGRQVHALLNPTMTQRQYLPSQQLFQRLDDERRQKMSMFARRRQQIFHNVQNVVYSTWDKLRIASTLSF